MPGRGRPWREGGIVDNTVTSDDIKQGTIKQEDIDPAYQAIIEGGGGSGAYELLKTETVPSDTISHTVTLTSPVNFADYAEFEIIVHGVIRSVDATPVFLFNGVSLSIYEYFGTERGSGFSGDVSAGANSDLRLQSDLSEVDSQYYIKITLEGGAILEATGTSGGSANPQRRGIADIAYIKDDGITPIYVVGRGGINLMDGFAETQLSSVTIQDQSVINAVIGQNTVISIFGKKIV